MNTMNTMLVCNENIRAGMQHSFYMERWKLPFLVHTNNFSFLRPSKQNKVKISSKFFGFAYNNGYLILRKFFLSSFLDLTSNFHFMLCTGFNSYLSLNVMHVPSTKEQELRLSQFARKGRIKI